MATRIPEGGISAKILNHMRLQPEFAWRAGTLAQALGVDSGTTSKYLRNLFDHRHLVRCEVIDPGKKRTEWEYRLAMGKAVEVQPLKASKPAYRTQEAHGATVAQHEARQDTQINGWRCRAKKASDAPAVAAQVSLVPVEHSAVPANVLRIPRPKEEGFCCSLDCNGIFMLIDAGDNMIELAPTDYQRLLAYLCKVEGLIAVPRLAA